MASMSQVDTSHMELFMGIPLLALINEYYKAISVFVDVLLFNLTYENIFLYHNC